MRVLMLTHDFPPKIGGIASHVYNLTRYLTKMGVFVDIITPIETSYKDLPAPDIEDNIRVFRILKSSIPKYREVQYIISAIRRIEKLKGNEYDIIHYHNLLPESILSKYSKIKLKIPSIFTNHESFFLYKFEEGKTHFLYSLIKHNDFIIAPSQELQEKTVLVGYPKEKTSFIPNGVDSTYFDPSTYDNETLLQIREQFKIPQNVEVILCPRRLAYKNGVHYAVRALKFIESRRDIRLVIAGGGTPSEVEFIRREIIRNRVHNLVIMLGNVPATKMRDLYAVSSIVILPSLKEAVSISGLEAMSMERPLVGTKVGGIPYLIENGKTGFLVKPGSPKELAEKLQILLDDKRLQRKFGKNARKKVMRKFDWKIISKKTLGIYLRVLESE